MTGTERRLRAFRATDEFAVEVFRATRRFPASEGAVLAAEIRRATVRAGGALVAASWGAGEDRSVDAARAGLLEARYYLSLARRLGLVEGRTYRQLTSRQDAAMRELAAMQKPAASGSGPSPEASVVESRAGGW